jgi:hypothetical protein
VVRPEGRALLLVRTIKLHDLSTGTASDRQGSACVDAQGLRACFFGDGGSGSPKGRVALIYIPRSFALLRGNFQRPRPHPRYSGEGGSRLGTRTASLFLSSSHVRLGVRECYILMFCFFDTNLSKHTVQVQIDYTPHSFSWGPSSPPAINSRRRRRKSPETQIHPSGSPMRWCVLGVEEKPRRRRKKMCQQNWNCSSPPLHRVRG